MVKDSNLIKDNYAEKKKKVRYEIIGIKYQAFVSVSQIRIRIKRRDVRLSESLT